jgi:hypothetical protein
MQPLADGGLAKVRAAAELDALIAELARAFGLGGREWKASTWPKRRG